MVVVVDVVVVDVDVEVDVADDVDDEGAVVLVESTELDVLGVVGPVVSTSSNDVESTTNVDARDFVVVVVSSGTTTTDCSRSGAPADSG